VGSRSDRLLHTEFDQMSFTCPICGYPDLSEDPDPHGAPSFEICPSCGTEFGLDEGPNGYDGLRQGWIERGMQWCSAVRRPPPEWNPEVHLASLPRYRCPVCGYAGLYEPPYDVDGAPASSPCHCCGTEFGVDDKLHSIVELRKRWVDAGMPWRGRVVPAPPSWNPEQQLAGSVDVR
jgi:transcription elongation factor Elf1